MFLRARKRQASSPSGNQHGFLGSGHSIRMLSASPVTGRTPTPPVGGNLRVPLTNRRLAWAESGWNQRRRLTYFYIVVVLTQRGPGKSTKLLPLGVYFTGFSKMSSDLEGA